MSIAIMDSDATTEKPCPGGDCSQDIISTLPEEILSRILSFLPTKDAVKTSVLSKKWIYMWTCITNLDVHENVSMKSRTRKEIFIHFMNRGVQKLDIEYRFGDKQLDFVLPYSFFKSANLVELKLKLENCLIRVPSDNFLSNLQILKIFRLEFVSNSLSEPRHIILRFPVLKDFEMAHCTWLNVQNIFLGAPQLESFSAAGIKFGQRNDDARNSVINICALDLRKFSYQGSLIHGLIFSNPTSVMEAFLNIAFEYGVNDSWHQAGVRACKLLTTFQKLKFLQLGCLTHRVWMDATAYVSTLPVFGGLVSLHLDMILMTSEYLKQRKLLLFILLHKSPVLERLSLSFYVEPESSADFSTSMVVPHCFTSSLKVVEFILSNCDMPSLSLPLYVLQNTTYLGHMTIKIAGSHKTGEMKNKSNRCYCRLQGPRK